MVIDWHNILMLVLASFSIVGGIASVGHWFSRVACLRWKILSHSMLKMETGWWVDDFIKFSICIVWWWISLDFDGFSKGAEALGRVVRKLLLVWRNSINGELTIKTTSSHPLNGTRNPKEHALWTSSIRIGGKHTPDKSSKWLQSSSSCLIKSAHFLQTNERFRKCGPHRG